MNLSSKAKKTQSCLLRDTSVLCTLAAATLNLPVNSAIEPPLFVNAGTTTSQDTFKTLTLPYSRKALGIATVGDRLHIFIAAQLPSPVSRSQVMLCRYSHVLVPGYLMYNAQHKPSIASVESEGK